MMIRKRFTYKTPVAEEGVGSRAKMAGAANVENFILDERIEKVDECRGIIEILVDSDDESA